MYISSVDLNIFWHLTLTQLLYFVLSLESAKYVCDVSTYKNT